MHLILIALPRQFTYKKIAASVIFDTILSLQASDESVAAGVAELSSALTADGLELVALVNNAGISHRLPLELDSIERVKAL